MKRYLFRRWALVFMCTMMLCALYGNSNSNIITDPDNSANDGTVSSDSTTALEVTGVAVSPSRLRMKGKPGETVIEKIKISNDTDRPNSFKISFFDFDMNGKGKSSFIEAGEGKYSLSKWSSVSPTFVELAPGERKEVTLTVSLPESEEGQRSAWSILMVEQANPREELDIPLPGEETIAFGIVPTYAFGVFLYQNPPNVSNSSVEITNFELNALDSTINKLDLEIENTGNGISYCTAYIELTNLSTGDQEKLTVKHFTILPELIRSFSHPLPDLPPGQYSAIGVLDFGSREQIEAAELEFEVK